MQKVAVKREFEPGLSHATNGKLCQPSTKWVPFFELGKDKAAKGEGWAPPFISCAQDKWDSNPHCPYGYKAMGNLYPLPFLVQVLQV